MVKLVFCLRRRSDLTREAFQQYWKETHAPLVRERAAALGVRRYVQVHSFDDPVGDALRESRGAPEPYDGVAELWFDSREALEEMFARPEAQQAGAELLEDEKKFIDLSRSPLWIANEHEVIG